MPELVPMPKLGFDMAEGTLVRKVKQDGEAVKKGEVLAEIETDKATVEVEAPASGVVKGWVVDEGQAVPVGALMAIIGAPDEQVDVAALKASAGHAQDGTMAKAAAEEVPQGAAGAAASQAAPQSGAGPAQVEIRPQKQNGKPPAGAGPEIAPAAGGGAPASPIARKMASEAGVDIQQIPGTGPGGRITKKDVEQYLSRPQPAAPVATPAVPTVSSQDQEVPLTRLRQLIARRMTESKQTVPQFYVNTEVDMAAAMELRRQLNSFVPEERKLSVNDLIIKAAALALRDFPNLNASFGGDKVVHKGRVNIGNAVAIEGGLLTVVVKDADQKSLGQIAAEMKAMVGRVRAGKVQGGDIEGSTFSVSNLGMYDVDHFIAIINPPEAAILATGAVKQVPVIKDGAVVPGQRMLATVSADHRVTDGAEAARFLQAVKQYLEEPMRLLL
ncbi:MAG: 2-oxo acid dehydrogenase subunit E2 [Anaerolineales bacterium]|nr:2-oxo acid dehydrogenase subunit E2 [Anaerolineales bacterium]